MCISTKVFVILLIAGAIISTMEPGVSGK